ncbi:MAG TPA: hypothetical protein VGG25_27775, partial [Streptosporangiaceae bacterium]
MATRAPRSASGSSARQGAGASRTRQAGGTGRTASSSGSRKAGTRSGSSRASGSGSRSRPAASPYRRSTTASRGRGKSAARRPPPPSNPLLILLGWLVAGLAGIWMALANTAGSAARAFGRHARDLDPVHQRDGLGLAALCGAIVTAAAIWWHLGLIGHPLTALMRGTLGSAAWTVPLLLVLLAVRFLRHPDDNADTGRMVIGWTALLFGVLGLIEIANGTPGPGGNG